MWLFKTASATPWEGKFLRTRSASNSLGSIWTTNRFRAATGNSLANPVSDTATASSGSGWELTTTTFLPVSAQRNASERLNEVLPTPPFPQKTMILDCIMRVPCTTYPLFPIDLAKPSPHGRLGYVATTKYGQNSVCA